MSDDSSSESPEPVVLFRDDPEFSDITGVPQKDSTMPNAPASIAYSVEYTDCMDTLRALIAKNELSERALTVTSRALDLGSGNYSVWHFRRQVLRALGSAAVWQRELDFTRQFALDNPKVYQLWFHRRVVVDMMRAHEAELGAVGEQILGDDKNYHMWSHLQWTVDAIFSRGGVLHRMDILKQQPHIDVPGSPGNQTLQDRAELLEYFSNVSRVVHQLLASCQKQDFKNNSYWAFRFNFLHALRNNVDDNTAPELRSEHHKSIPPDANIYIERIVHDIARTLPLYTKDTNQASGSTAAAAAGPSIQPIDLEQILRAPDAAQRIIQLFAIRNMEKTEYAEIALALEPMYAELSTGLLARDPRAIVPVTADSSVLSRKVRILAVLLYFRQLQYHQLRNTMQCLGLIPLPPSAEAPVAADDATDQIISEPVAAHSDLMANEAVFNFLRGIYSSRNQLVGYVQSELAALAAALDIAPPAHIGLSLAMFPPHIIDLLLQQRDAQQNNKYFNEFLFDYYVASGIEAHRAEIKFYGERLVKYDHIRTHYWKALLETTLQQ